MKGALAGQGRRPDALRYTASPLGRTRDTMERVRDALGLDPSGYDTDARLREIGFGDWEGRTWADLKATVRPMVKERQRNKWSFVPPGGESYAGLAQRLRPWAAELEAGAVVVAHGGVCRALLHLLAGKATAEAPGIEIVQGRVLWFRRGRAEWF